jgi:hypothetical protein
MIKKILILAILGGLGYVGYLVWTNLTPKEQDVVSNKVGEAGNWGKDQANKIADKLTGVAKDEIKKIDKDDKTKADKKDQDDKAKKDDEPKQDPPEAEKSE